tara:strand:+ start:254 stop:376 length:123 start_codon:yes stop_codon:yes gene_type:complete
MALAIQLPVFEAIGLLQAEPSRVDTVTSAYCVGGGEVAGA